MGMLATVAQVLWVTLPTQLPPEREKPFLHAKSHVPLTQVASALLGAAHARLLAAYEHAPPPHVPLDAKLWRIAPLTHEAAGGVLHVTPAHGSPTQAPALQPLVQLVSVGAYAQVPALHVPIDA